jgi:hypothetical protein
VVDVKEGRDPATVPADIYALLADSADHEVSEENVEWAGEVFKDLLRSRLKRREEVKGEAVLRFSSLGKQDRQLWYAANMPEKAEKFSGKQLFKFLYGDVLEVLLLFLTKEAGHEVTHLQHEVDVDGIKGHMDAVIDGVPVDCKSASPFSYQKFADGTFTFDDPFGYVPQLSGYAHALGRTDRAGFLVCDKVHGDICFAELDEVTIEGNSPGPRISSLRGVLAQEQPPERCYPDQAEGKSGNRKLGISCSYCPFKDECWKDANGGKGLRKFVYARGPVWLTNVAREPKVEES